MPRLRPSNLKCVSAVIRYKIVVNIFHYSPDGRKGDTQAPRAWEDDDGGSHGSRGRVLARGNGGAGNVAGWSGRWYWPPTFSSLSSRWNSEADRRENGGRGRKRGSSETWLEGVKCHRNGEGWSPAPRTYSANLRIHEDERVSERANSGIRASERGVFCYVNFFCVPLSSMLEKKLVKHIKEARWLTWTVLPMSSQSDVER